MPLYPGAIIDLVPGFDEPMDPVRVNAHTAVVDVVRLRPREGKAWHFYIYKDGTVYQFVDTSCRAAADGAGNPDTISIEVWDGYPSIWDGSDPVPDYTDAQRAAMVRLLAWIFEAHPKIPRKMAADSVPGPTSHGLSWHRLGIDPWRVAGGLTYSPTPGKPCPGDAKIESLWAILAEALGVTLHKYNLGVHMQNPAVGRMTSVYGPRAPIPGVTTATFHAGIDIANVIGTDIVAAFAGRVIAAGENIVPYRSGLGVLIENPDGEAQYYGHLSKILVKVGQWVDKSALIGKMGATGNVTGPHLHFEIWANAKDHKSHRDPLIDFKHFGITPGVGAPVKTVPEADQIRLEASGHYTGEIDGIAGPLWDGAVRAFQRENGLREDGDFGQISRKTYDTRYYGHHKAVQERLKALIRPSTGRPYYEGAVDGIVGTWERNAVGAFQTDHGLLVDHVWGARSQATYEAVVAKPAPEPAPKPEPEPEPKPQPEPEPEPKPQPEPEPAPEAPPVVLPDGTDLDLLAEKITDLFLRRLAERLS